MLLYLYPAACSVADHIALIEAGLAYELMPIDREKRTANGRDYLTINPRGFIPALELEDGTVLTENLAILAYIADKSGKLLPDGEFGRWRALEALSYMATTVHGGLGPFFKNASEADKEKGANAVTKAFAFLDEQMGDKPFLLGQAMSIADPYLFWALLWAPVRHIGAGPARGILRADAPRAVRHPRARRGRGVTDGVTSAARDMERCCNTRYHQRQMLP